MKPLQILPILFVCTGMLFYGCGNANESDAVTEIQLVDLREATFTTPERYMSIDEPEDIFFQRPFMLKTGPDGLYYLADGAAQHILRFDQDGQFVSKIGSSGRGPGEFQQLSGFFFSNDNRLYVYDANGFWVNRFEWDDASSDWEFADRFSIFSFDSSGSPGRMPFVPFPLSDGNVAATYTFNFNFSADGTDEEPAPVLVRVFSPEGDELRNYAFPAKNEEMMPLEGSQGMMFIPKPFSGSNMVQVTPEGRVLHNWSVENIIKEYHLREASEGSDAESAETNAALASSHEVPLVPKPLTSDDSRAFIDAVNPSNPSAIRAAMPDYQPFFQSLIVSDDGIMYFTGFTGMLAETPHEIIRFDANSGEITGLFKFDGRLSISQVQNGLLYGILFDEDGYGEPVVYRVDS
ncbi:MAG: 6-bladed beta-propeller [Balneolia bacterium]|nr:6-bladed beta-propeller [Balneolia bacterium]